MDPMTAPLSQLSAWMTSLMDRGPVIKDGATTTGGVQPLDLSWTKSPGHSERFINQEDLRSESYMSASSVTESDTDQSTSSGSPPIPTFSPVQRPNTSTNVFSYSTFGNVSPPTYITGKTYITGNFLHTSPQTNPNEHVAPSTATVVTIKQERVTPPFLEPRPAEPRRRSTSFTIDAILGPDFSDRVSTSDQPARVVSAFSQATFPGVFSGLQSTIPQGQLFFWCHVCRDFLSGRDTADRHQLLHQQEGATCDMRRALFRQHGYVTQHEQTGFLNRVKCGLCSKIVADCFFSKHLRCHDGHVCHVCDHEFSTNSRLQDHLNIHTGLKPFSCNLCDRKFTKRSSLNQHARYHREYKSFQCTFCFKYFNSKYACSVHQRLHTGNNPFKCHVTGCSKAFPQKIQLKLHLNTHMRRGDL